MKIGFTGTRNGMTEEQKQKFAQTLQGYKPEELHSGDCVGADDEANKIAYELGFQRVLHPPTKEDLRAFGEYDQTREPKSYFARNRNIVDETDMLIATPATSFQTKGGTWYTIDYAKREGKPVLIIYPTGESGFLSNRPPKH